MQAPLKQPPTEGQEALIEHERSAMINNMPSTKEKKSNMASNNKGFTLVEVMIGMAIFVIGYLAVASMQIVAIKGDANGRKTTEAATLAANQLETLMVLPYDNIEIVPPDNTGTVTRGAYTVNWEFTAGPLDNTKIITINVVWQHGGQRTFEASYIKSANM